MKVITLTKYKTKLLKLKLLKTKIFSNQKNFSYLLLKDMETRLKKVLHIIYQFHIANKKILFIGTPLRLNNEIKQLLKNKKHSFIPESVWMNGIITNSKASFKHLLKQHNINNDRVSKSLFSLKNQIDLIVVLDEKLNIVALKESLLKHLPIISLNSSNNLSNFNIATYKVPGNYNFIKKNIRYNVFFLLLSSLLKKAEILRKKYIQRTKKQKKFKRTRKNWNQKNYKKNVFSKKK